MAPPKITPRVRLNGTPFFRYVSPCPLTGCYWWTRAINSTGERYGSYRLRGRKVPVHRHAYEAASGAIPAGYVVHHTCGQPLCCNPQHLQLITWEQHSRLHRLQEPKVMFSKRGHSMADVCILKRGSRKGRRECRVCVKETSAPLRHGAEGA